MPNGSINDLIFMVSLIACAVAVIAWLATAGRGLLGANRGYGSNQDRQAGESGNPSTAALRETVAARLRTKPVSAADAARFSHEWTTLQCRFVDNPRGVVAEADHLVRELLERHGYPMSGYAQLEEDLSEYEPRTAKVLAEHPAVVTTYLAAQAITTRHGRSEADTEVLRKAVVYYRMLFNELLGFSTAAGARSPTLPTLSLHA